MNHDALIIPLNDTEELVVASDNSGSIGKKPFDEISVPYDIVGYSVFRVAYMECAAAGGVPFSIIMHNFNGDDVWGSLINGIRRGFTELGIQELPITGSTESNFILKQSATSMTILGKRPRKEVDRRFNRHCHVAIIGKPLVGNEVLAEPESIAPLWLFQWFCEQDEVLGIIPVGSKGILSELKKTFPHHTFQFPDEIDVTASAGPATSFVAIYDRDDHDHIKKKADKWFQGYAVLGEGNGK